MTLTELCAAVLGLAAEQVDDTTAAATTGGWTSLAHVQLVVALEDAYGVTLSAAEIRRLTSVGAIRAALAGKGVVVG
ncbi:MAG TPA: acyl carrier protein [Streptosporangiaceae bacterium]|nr:acyl carrier protein [Streptosporangiaceae bacterium]